MKNIGIIGTGVVGTAMGVVLNAKGYEITGVYDIHPESTKKLAERIHCRIFHSPMEASDTADILLITSNDNAIGNVVDTLAGSNGFHSGQIIIHMSGAQSAEILDKARDFGARVLSVHPLQAFANLEMAIQNLPGSVFSIEGDKDAYETAVNIVETLGGEYFFIDSKAKPLYNAGACVVSNYLVTLIDLGVKMLESTGIPKKLAVKALLPLINGTIRNVEIIGIPGALTGPIARGDFSTVEKHLDCLEDRTPELLKLYSSLGEQTAQIAMEKGTIGVASMEAFQQIFSDRMAETCENVRRQYLWEE